MQKKCLGGIEGILLTKISTIDGYSAHPIFRVDIKIWYKHQQQGIIAVKGLFGLLYFR